MQRLKYPQIKTVPVEIFVKKLDKIKDHMPFIKLFMIE